MCGRCLLPGRHSSFHPPSSPSSLFPFCPHLMSLSLSPDWDFCVDCKGIPFGANQYDACGECRQRDSTLFNSCSNLGCDLVLNSGYRFDSCNKCRSPNDPNWNDCQQVATPGKLNPVLFCWDGMPSSQLPPYLFPLPASHSSHFNFPSPSIPHLNPPCVSAPSIRQLFFNSRTPLGIRHDAIVCGVPRMEQWRRGDDDSFGMS